MARNGEKEREDGGAECDWVAVQLDSVLAEIGNRLIVRLGDR